ncbi:DUF4181 domain-containing protein [Salibacterium sp. K-3]
MVLPETDPGYINKFHRYMDKSFYVLWLFVVIATINDFYSYRIVIFIVPVLLFAFRTVMWCYTPGGRQTYLLSAVPCALFLTGTGLYGFFSMG